ncbi:lipopolysaccharide biosynthesis protein [Actinomycetospora chibensis]|uniref:Lipopolysaccharide biosynthesis protein n=1 Tax=Actinomycetospora chibensis TaxID=663606 RepID=A0ABV9RNF7_9PSEU|nr:oligosaccharide flippase family protein [Actinomycetospora chibensis]MDD7923284.1 oligosaccharide flippase family protein [Actinomycetospora chibensis]
MRLVAAARDVGFVSFGRYGQYVVTIVTVPLIARLLGPEGLGLVAVGMSSYFIGSLLVDLGITQFLAATIPGGGVRQIRGNYLAIRASIFGTIVGALLLGLVLGAGPVVTMILLGLSAGGASSMSEDWVLIGQGRFGASMAYQGAGRIAYLVLLIVVLPRYPHAAVALICLLLSSIVTVGLTWRDSLKRFGRPERPRHVLIMIRKGIPVLTSRLLVSSFGLGSATIYSSVLDAASLGLFSAGDRLLRAIQGQLDAIGLALLPRMARVGGADRFWKRAVFSMLVCVGIACVATATVWVTAPTLIGVMFGDGFADAVPLLRVEAFILPATALTSFATTAVLPVRQDTTGVLIGAVIGTCVAAVWFYVAVRTHSVWALAYGTLSSEVALALWYIIRMRILKVRDRNAGHGETDRVVADGEVTVP